jgi:actin-related protein
MSEEKKDFVVKDRRLFSEEKAENETVEPSEKTETAEPSEAPESATEESAAEESAAPDQDNADTETEENFQLPEINFPTFIFSLNSSALVHLGVIEDPASQQKVKNLPLAKQTIDILGMLEEKTQGNLLDDEANMLKTMLYELRMLYVKESQ